MKSLGSDTTYTGFGGEQGEVKKYTYKKST